jgi:C1A family cysteine protease
MSSKPGLPREPGISLEETLFTIYDSIVQTKINGGKIPFPTDKESIRGGHAMMTVGYDDNKIITNEVDGTQTRGAFLIRNSWGTQWGDNGYGWLPYEYVRIVLAQDWWTLMDAGWVDLTVFGRDAQQQQGACEITKM